MNSRWQRLVLAALILAACATTQATPRQDYTYDIGRNCETSTTKIERVDPDGRYWILARGVGASTSAASYPSRLAEELVRRFPGHKFTVLNRGVGGEDVSNMLARLDTAVIREKPDLVLWQVGTNSVLDGKAVQPHASLLREGLTRLKATGADVVLIDLQYAPKVIARRNADGMVSLIAATAKAEHVCHFRRFDLMRQWHETEHLPFKTFVSPDGLHMNDWSYACLAKALGLAIAEAAERPTATAIGPSIAPR